MMFLQQLVIIILPTGINSEVAKKPISIAVSLIDKIDIWLVFLELMKNQQVQKKILLH